MTDLLFKYLGLWYGCGGDLFMYFTLSSGYTKSGQWGLTDDITKSSVKTAAVDRVLNTPRNKFECSSIQSYTPSGASGEGTGLTGQYFTDTSLSQPTLTRIDPMVNFLWDRWGVGRPAPKLSPDQFSVRWTGKVMPKFSETYTFHTSSDDGVRLWVNGQLLIDNWIEHKPTLNSDTIALEAGKLYDIKLEFFAKGGGEARLYWSSPSQPMAIVPQSQLYSQ